MALCACKLLATVNQPAQQRQALLNARDVYDAVGVDSRGFQADVAVKVVRFEDGKDTGEIDLAFAGVEVAAVVLAREERAIEIFDVDMANKRFLPEPLCR